MKSHAPIHSRQLRPATQAAFSLLEVMIAIILFVVASFAILQLVSQSLSNARRLERPLVDASPILSKIMLTASTNQNLDGEYSGNLGDLLGKTYENYLYKGEIVPENGTNALREADFVILNAGNQEVVSRTATLILGPPVKTGGINGLNPAR